MGKNPEVLSYIHKFWKTHILTASLQELAKRKGRKGKEGQREGFYHGNFIGKRTKKVRSASHWVAITGSKAIRRKFVRTQAQFHTYSLIPSRCLPQHFANVFISSAHQ